MNRSRIRSRRLVWAFVAAIGGCAPSIDTGCGADDDCAPGRQCVAGRCLAGSSADTGAGGAGGHDTDAGPGSTPDAVVAGDAQSGTPDLGAVADDGVFPDAHVNTKPDANRGDAASPDAVVPPPGDALVPPPGDALVPPPGDALVPPPADAFVPPPADAFVPPPADAFVPPPDPDAFVPPPDPDAFVPPPDPDAGPPCVPSDEICDGLDNDCDDVVDNLELPCTAGEGLCVAAGVLICTPGGAQRCEATLGAPQPEQCDRIDNDCDGLIDENQFGETLAVTCYEGPPGTRGVGVCTAGERTCDLNSGTFGDCNFQTQPSEERCDALDNNCNGTVDDIVDPPDCYQGDPLDLMAPATACRTGLELCTAGQVACTGQVLPAEIDGCNGVNDDCDEEIDEDCLCQAGEPCEGDEIGICRPGRQICVDNELAGCDGQVVPEDTETCDGEDDDCDGETDEGTDETCFDGDPTLTGVGVCRSGVRACLGGELADTCDGQILPGPETCDGRDEDCNGLVDDGFDPAVGDECEVGVGICRRTATVICTENGEATFCPALAGQAGSEICNGQDDDCDGVIDDGADVVCYDGREGTLGVGNCVAGVRTCRNGVLGTCVGQVTPQAELCNGRHEDEDCNGQTDEICQCEDGEVLPCGNDTPPCMAGRQTCVGGQYGPCMDAQGPTPEVCDEVDNDCNGTSDDIPADVCYTGPAGTQGVGLCVSGRRGCKNGHEVCGAEIVPVAETCDGLDNDCDGVVDDAVVIAPSACDTGLLGACRQGQRSCVGGQVVCRQTVQPAAEVCNQVDDDCDGTADEPPILTRAEYTIDQTAIANGRPGFVSSDNGFIGVFGATNQNEGSVRARVMDRAGTPLQAVTLLWANAGVQNLRAMKATPVSPDRADANRRYVAGWLENGRIRLQPLGDDGTTHGAAVLTITGVANAVINAFDLATTPTGIAVAWTENEVAGTQRIMAGIFRDDGVVIARPIVLPLAPAIRSSVAIAVNTADPPPLLGIAWAEGVAGAGPVKVAILGDGNDPITGTVANLGQLGDVVATSTGFAITWIENAGNTIYARRFQRDGTPAAAIAVSQAASNRTGLTIDALSDGGLGILFHEEDGIWYHRLGPRGNVHPQRARVGSFGSSGLDATLSRGGTAAFWVYGARAPQAGTIVEARMALGEFLCPP